MRRISWTTTRTILNTLYEDSEGEPPTTPRRKTDPVEYLFTAFLERDILLRPLGNTLYFLPPYIVTDEEAHRVFDAIGDVVGSL